VKEREEERKTLSHLSAVLLSAIGSEQREKRGERSGLSPPAETTTCMGRQKRRRA